MARVEADHRSVAGAAEGIQAEAVDLDLASVDTSGVALAADWQNLRSLDLRGTRADSGVFEPMRLGFTGGELARRLMEDVVTLVSATMPGPIKKLADRFLSNPKTIEVARPATANINIAQHKVMVSSRGKRDALRHLLRQLRTATMRLRR